MEVVLSLLLPRVVTASSDAPCRVGCAFVSKPPFQPPSTIGLQEDVVLIL
ncbi:hypothetical protein M758_UG274900 [Ceratodon purpureus]|nr:hypothetical protein M758_UG274900 [Ceratodon purpureus]